MRLSSKLTRMAATLLATAMLACTAALPASAEGGTVTGSTMSIKTTLKMPANLVVPNATISYTVEKADPNESDLDGVEAGVNGVVTVASASFTPDDSNGKTITSDYTVEKTSTLTAAVGSFGHAGIYKYTVTPSCTTPGMSCDEANILYVYIANENTGLKVANIVMFSGDPTEEATGKTADFEASYNNTVGDFCNLVLSKTVKGDFGDKTKPFSFNVKVTPNNTDDKYYYETGTVNDKGVFTRDSVQKADQFIDAAGADITLSHGKAIMVYGLVKGDKYEIKETKVDTYSTSATSTDSGATTADGATEYTVANSTGLTTMSDIAVVYTNDRTSTPATGVVMNVAPYILLVVIAVAGAFVFLRKRRED